MWSMPTVWTITVYDEATMPVVKWTLSLPSRAQRQDGDTTRGRSEAPVNYTDVKPRRFCVLAQSDNRNATKQTYLIPLLR